MDSESPRKFDNTVNLAEEFAFSSRFKTLFQDGMTLVEESAAYLDGPGREEAKRLGRTLVTLYGTESMSLTTRLMQLASWLLLQRAANEGEMSSEQFLEEKKKVRPKGISAFVPKKWGQIFGFVPPSTRMSVPSIHSLPP